MELMTPAVRERLLKGEAVDWIPKVYRAEVTKDVDLTKEGGGRTFTFVLSTKAYDRDGDSIDPAGWQLDNFRKAGGPVLFAHKHDKPPIAKTAYIQVVGGALKGRPEFPSRGIYPFADLISDLVDFGSLKMTSVGFHPIGSTVTRNKQGGVDIGKSELLEWSILPIGAHPDALLEAKSIGGIDLAPLAGYCEEVLAAHGGPGMWIPKEDALRVLKMATGERVTVAVPATKTGAGEPSGAPSAPPGDHAPLAPVLVVVNDGDPQTIAKAVGDALKAGFPFGKDKPKDEDEKPEMVPCPKCKKDMPKGGKCPECGYEEKAATVKIHEPQIVKDGDKWKVVDSDGKVYGSHDSEEKAKAQLAALHAAKSATPNTKAQARAVWREFLKCYDMPVAAAPYLVPPSEPKTFADIVSEEQARKISYEVMELESIFMRSVGSIVESGGENAIELIQESLDQFSEALQKLPKEKSGPVYQKAGRALSRAREEALREVRGMLDNAVNRLQLLLDEAVPPNPKPHEEANFPDVLEPEPHPKGVSLRRDVPITIVQKAEKAEAPAHAVSFAFGLAEIEEKRARLEMKRTGKLPD